MYHKRRRRQGCQSEGRVRSSHPWKSAVGCLKLATGFEAVLPLWLRDRLNLIIKKLGWTSGALSCRLWALAVEEITIQVKYYQIPKRKNTDKSGTLHKSQWSVAIAVGGGQQLKKIRRQAGENGECLL